MTKQEYRRKYIHHLPLACQRFINSRNKWGRWTKLSIDYFIKLLKNPNYYYDYKDVNIKLKLCNLFKHWKGELSNERFKPEPFQVFVICAIFGIKDRRTNKRVIKEFYLSVARKNGKSFFLAVIALLHALSDKEEGFEIYTSATTERQASLLWKDIFKVIGKETELKKLFKRLHNTIEMPLLNGQIRPLGGDSKSLDGLNASLAIVDEYHAHSSNEILSVLQSSQGTRKQPLTVIITTAGDNNYSPCKIYEDYCKQVLDGIFENDTIFPLIFQLDDCDDIFDETKWYKSNPGLTIFKSIDQFKKEATQAKQLKSKLADFTIKSCNRWFIDSTEWISVREFSQLAKVYSPEELKGKDCYIGVDLSKSSDLTVLSLIFPVQSGIDKVHIQPIFYIPNKTAQIKELEDRVPYSEWEEEGYVNLTEEPIISQKQILDTILEIASSYRVLKVYYDAYQFSILKEVLEENNIHCESVPQNAIHLTPLIRIFEDMIKLNNITHSGNPCLIWNLSNCRLKESDSRLLKIVKDKPNQKIDGIIASLVGMKGLEQTKQEPQGDILDFLK